ncbi:hypothetical protein [Photobacterium damselae]|uniref:hypothetical protein n=1 Tax=Photobacterium damselae TaxID=38293 RepID=UPI001CD9595D|nr:hypothetical protein [Photobacterium damselae]
MIESNTGTYIPEKPASPAILVSKEKTTSIDPFKCLEMNRDSKKELVHQKTIDMAYAKCHIVLTLLKTRNIKDIRRLQAEEARTLLSQYPVNATKHKQFSGMKGQQLIKNINSLP